MKSATIIVYVLICSLVSTTLPVSVGTTSKKVLHILTTAPYPDPMDDAWHGGIALTTAVRLALKQLNDQSNILQDYELEAIEDNSGCEVTPTATMAFFRNSLYSGKNIVGLIGPACSGSTLVLAPLLARQEINMIQIAPTATSPRIEAQNYSTTFTMIGSSAHIINSFTALMKHNSWTRVATLYDIDRDTFSAFNFKLLELLGKQEELQVVYTSHVLVDVANNAFVPLDRIVTQKARVIFLLTRRSTALKILCLAHHMEMTYPVYQWVISAETRIEAERSFEDFDFQYNGVVYQCTQDILSNALNGSVVLSYNLQADHTTKHTFTNLVYTEYRQLYLDELQAHLNEPSLRELYDTTASSLLPLGNWENAYYDATWAFALALDRVSRKGLELSQYRRGQSNITETLIEELLKVNFNGATGQVSFTDSKNIESVVVISQLWVINGTVEKTIAAYYSKNKLIISNTSRSDFIPNTFINVPEYIHEGLGFCMIALAVILMFITGILQLLFIAWSDRKWIKAASPDVNHLIFSGCYLFALATILYSLQKTTNSGLDYDGHTLYYSIICNALTWFMLTGYTLIFGTAFIKIWRVYRLFKHFKNKKPTCLKDKVLISAIIVLLVVDASFCVSWNILDPWVKTETLSNQPQVKDKVFVTLSCRCTYMFYWIGGAAAYKGTIAILLVIISTLNRKIQREHFRHTKKVNALVYGLTIMYGVGFPLYFLLDEVSIYVSYLIMCTVLIGTVLLCCCMLFIPPVMNVIKTKIGRH